MFSHCVWRDDGEVGSGVCLCKIVHINAYPICGHMHACLLKMFNLNFISTFYENLLDNYRVMNH